MIFVSTAKCVWRTGSERPEATAIVWGCRTISYGELLRRASFVGNALHQKLGKIQRDSPIAICTDEAPQLIIAALGGWKAGFAYLPIDPSAPEERSAHMLAESGVRLVLAKASVADRFRSGPWEVMVLDGFTRGEVPDEGSAEDFAFADWTEYPNDLAYVIYTSGSTGKPKGVAVTQANLMHLVEWYGAAFQVGPQDRATQMAALTFDASVLEIWTVLSQGATLMIPDRTLPLEAEKLRDYLVTHGVTISFVSTAVAEQLISLPWPTGTKLRFLLTGGDALRKYPPSGLPFALINNYGPTECTVLASCCQVPVADGHKLPPTIGHAIRGAKVLVLGPDFQPVKDGARGEIFIGGAGVAAGYMGQPELTQEKFIQRPDVMGGLRLYRTGDLGRKLPSGELEYCGRLDEQIKMRGYRIEPAEIVAALREHPAVSAAAVQPWGADATRQLIGYVTLRDESEIDGSGLRSHLASRLPAYMIPDCFVRLDRMPMTQSGKVDRAALPEPSTANLMEQPVDTGSEPATEIQAIVASLLSSLLKGRPIGPRDNFFRSGGNSLLAAQVIARIRHEFGVDLPLRTVFDSPTVLALSAEVETRVLRAMESVPPEELLKEQS